MTDVDNRALQVPGASLAFGGNIHLPHATTAVTYYVPPHWRGKWLTIKSYTSTLYYAFGDAGVDLKASGYSASTAVGSSEPKYITPAGNAGWPVGAGEREDIKVPFDQTHVCFVSDAASGYFYLRVSDVDATELLPPGFQGGGAALLLDVSRYSTLTVASSDVAAIRNYYNPTWSFAEASNRPAYTAASAETLVNGRANAAYTAGNSDKLVCTAADCAALFGGTSAFSLFLGFSRGATGAAHTLFSVGTNGSANGRWDLTLDASDDLVITRVDSGGSSSTSTYATTVTGAPTSHIFSYIYDGAGGNTAYIDRVAVSLSGSATGDVGTLSKVSIGCRGYNSATYDQFATGKMTSVLAYPRALSTAEIDKVHEWFIYRLGL